MVLFASPVFSEMNVYIEKTDVKVTENSGRYVRFSWKVDIFSHETETKSCTLQLSFRDAEGFELDSVYKRIVMPYGSSSFTGLSLCKTDLWNQVKKWHTLIKCR